MAKGNKFHLTICDVQNKERCCDLEWSSLLKEQRETERNDRNLKPIWEWVGVLFPVICLCISHSVSHPWSFVTLLIQASVQIISKCCQLLADTKPTDTSGLLAARDPARTSNLDPCKTTLKPRNTTTKGPELCYWICLFWNWISLCWFKENLKWHFVPFRKKDVNLADVFSSPVLAI